MIEQWVDVASKSTEAVAGEMGFEECRIVGTGTDLPKGLAGAFVPLVGTAASVQLGVMSSRDGQEGLARIVLQMEPDEALERDDINDAVGEFANCLVGRIKREMRKTDPTLRIGLPVFIEGSVEDIGRSQFRTVRAMLNKVEVTVLVVLGS